MRLSFELYHSRCIIIISTRKLKENFYKDYFSNIETINNFDLVGNLVRYDTKYGVESGRSRSLIILIAQKVKKNNRNR